MGCWGIGLDGKTDQRSVVKKCRLQICTSSVEQYCSKSGGAKVFSTAYNATSPYFELSYSLVPYAWVSAGGNPREPKAYRWEQTSGSGSNFGFKDVLSDVGLSSTMVDPIARGAKNILDNRGEYMPNGHIYNMNRDITIRTPLGGINTTSKVLNFARIGGKVLFVAGIAATGYQVYNDLDKGNYATAGARSTVFGIAAGATCIPVVGWGVALGIGAADYFWGDQFYNYLSTNRNQY